ncbi:unnamed protein product, partial [Brachionus calyciflorus]
KVKSFKTPDSEVIEDTEMSLVVEFVVSSSTKYEAKAVFDNRYELAEFEIELD